MKVPAERCPQHHCYLPSGRRRGLEVCIAGIRDRRYKKIVIVQCRSFVPSCSFPTTVAVGQVQLIRRLLSFVLLVIVVARLQDYSPAWRKEGMVDVEVIGSEGETCKYW